MAGNEAVHLLVGGKVQGVGFRYFVQRSARALGLVGFVRNLPDGRVEALAEGAAGNLERLVRDVQRGPSMSHVTRMDRRDVEPKGSYEDFEITF